MQSFAVVGYTYRADTYCPGCILDLMRESDRFDGVDPDAESEHALDYFAGILGIDRMDEATYDSGDFPKVVFADSAADYPHGHDGDEERCGRCGETLL